MDSGKSKKLVVIGLSVAGLGAGILLVSSGEAGKPAEPIRVAGARPDRYPTKTHTASDRPKRRRPHAEARAERRERRERVRPDTAPRGPRRPRYGQTREKVVVEKKSPPLG